MNKNSVTLINVLSVEPSNQEKLIAILKRGTEEIMTKQEGYISSQIYKSKDGHTVTVIAEWESPKNIEAVRSSSQNINYFKSIQEIADSKANLYSLIGV